MSAWIDQIAGQANAGNVVRRSIHSVMTYASAKELQNAVKKKGFHMAVIGSQYIIVCNKKGTIHVIC